MPRQINIQAQTDLLGRLITASTGNGSHAPEARTRICFGANAENAHILKRLLKDKLVEREVVGGGAHRAVHGYKPTQAGLELHKKRTQENG